MTKEQYLRNPCRALSLPYWKAANITIPESMLIVHEEDFDKNLLQVYLDEPYFRLKHSLADLSPVVFPYRFALCSATVEEYAEHINNCYQHIGITADELQTYTNRPVYCPDLWIAVKDCCTDEIVASGIGEIDYETGEGVLEWIQVSHYYRRLGLGRCVVRELLWRMKGRAQFATVSGLCSHSEDPEMLYRKCGFSGTDIWHILRRK